jgi:hypothetical protein
MMHAVEMASCCTIYLRSFIKIGTGVQAISRFTSEIWRAVVLVLQMGGIYDARR